MGIAFEIYRSLEKSLRNFRDEQVIRRLLRSKRFSQHIPVVTEEWRGLAKDDIAILRLDDHLLAFDPKDLHAPEIQQHRGWAREETLRVFDALPGRRGTFVDVGANIGAQTVYALKLGGFDRAVCFEPDPKACWLLEFNLLINGIADRTTVIKAGAGSSSGTAPLSLGDGMSALNSMASRRSDSSIDVEVVSAEEALNKLGIHKHDIGLVWIDVEGYEAEVLKGWPSLAGIPVCIECTPRSKDFPEALLGQYRQWAKPQSRRLTWRSIDSFDRSQFKPEETLDLLFA